MNKYDSKSKEKFGDPVVRCDSCQNILLRETIRKLGCCSKCGNKRIRNVLVIQPDEMAKCKEWGVDAEFLALFEEVDEITPTAKDPAMEVPNA